MYIPKVRLFRLLLGCGGWALLLVISVGAQSTGSLRGRVVDPLGNPVAGAKIVLLQADKEVVQGKSGADGSFELAIAESGRYTPRVGADGFMSSVAGAAFP